MATAASAPSASRPSASATAASLDSGQRPPTMVVACVDSRSGPEAVFDAGPGELFIVRNVAALVPVYTPDNRFGSVSAALEYAVLGLGIGAIVVMGHGRCGGVEAALDTGKPLSSTDFMGAWIAGLRDLADALDPTAGPIRRATGEPWSTDPSSTPSSTSPRSRGSGRACAAAA